MLNSDFFEKIRSVSIGRLALQSTHCMRGSTLWGWFCIQAHLLIAFRVMERPHTKYDRSSYIYAPIHFSQLPLFNNIRRVERSPI